MEGVDSEIVKLAENGHNIIYTGQCGTGKTVLMRKIIQILRDDGKVVAVTAATGMAAHNYHEGTTLHHWCGIGDVRHRKEEILAGILPTETAKKIRGTDVLVVDEIGMISSTVFETAEYVCRKIRKMEKPFGGLQIVTCGDFKQLAPVPNMLHNDPGLPCFTSRVFNLTFPHKLNLTDVKRQDEPALVNAVRELCDGNPSAETCMYMQSLERPLPEEQEPTLLFGTNFDCDFHNHEQLDDVDGQQRLYRCDDSGDRTKLRKSPAPRVLALKVGAPVILTRNIAGYVNGMRGTVHELGRKPIVNFNGKLVEVNKYRHEIYNTDAGFVKACRLQFPLKLAFALTVHRAQGQTLPCVEIDCHSFFAPGQLGVALGRSVASNSLRVLNFNEKSATIKHPDYVYNYYNTLGLGQMCPVLSCCNDKPFMSTEDTNHIVVSTNTVSTVHSVPDPEQLASCSGTGSCSSPPQYTIPDIPIDLVDTEKFTLDNPMTMNDAKLNRHVRIVQSKMQELMPTNRQSKEAWTRSYEKLNSFLISDTHQSLIRELFGSDTISKKQNKYATKLVFYINKQLVDKQASSITAKQTITTPATISESCLTNPAKAKIRYIGGACLAKITGRLRLKAVSNITSATNKPSRRAAYSKHNILSKLRTSEAETVAQTSIPESLSEIDEKQGQTRGLYHMSDEVYCFFVSLSLKTTELLSQNLFEVEGDNAFLKCRETLFNDDSLNTTWCKLLVDDETDEVIRVLQEGMCHELYCMVSEYFLRIRFVDALHQFKESIPKKKKLALRAKIAGATGEKKRKADDGKYICPTCNAVCPDEPLTASDQSIGCDGCNRWYHQSCQRLTDTTKLKVWKCPDCKKKKVQRRR